ncbi:MAG: putative rane protein [Solirubrobacterales bacterium]|nr:putative rane protein [Solirubrobacterales bacterium]
MASSSTGTGDSRPADGVARAHRGLALLFLAAVVVQFFLAGLGAFGESYAAHRALGNALGLIGLVLVILAAVGRREALQASAVLFVLLIVQAILGSVGDDVRVLGALHPVNALAILGVGSLTAAGAPLRFGHGRRSEARL